MSVSVGMFVSSPSMANSPEEIEDRHFVFAIRLPDVSTRR
jgi:hypothetical protein